MIKITEETKIKELIPDGYEIGSSPIGNGDRGVTIIFKKKEVKDFNWYLKKYIEQSNPSNRHFPFIYEKRIEDTFLCLMTQGNYVAVPFELKIGLLKFICDDLKVTFPYVIHSIAVSNKEALFTTELRGLKDVLSICPKEFINSLFE
jgi:hypothetical protein